MSSLYEQFEKLNSSHIAKLETQNQLRNVTEFNSQFMCKDIVPVKDPIQVKQESLIFKHPFGVNESCTNIDTDYRVKRPNCYGYDCDKDSFYHQPEKRNTFHNYLVTNDKNTLACTQNHQYFNNWTKRNNEALVSKPIKNIIINEDCIPMAEPILCNKYNF